MILYGDDFALVSLMLVPWSGTSFTLSPLSVAYCLGWVAPLAMTFLVRSAYGFSEHDGPQRAIPRFLCDHRWFTSRLVL
ncbi:hypothetical protein J3R82DRAFT_7482 [Butyriboletus roseoflavus]|nr:hypothetical protein J3R82DRAFT_7482 [Butyriboletus roseoflavus]